MNPERGRQLWAELDAWARRYPREGTADAEREARAWLAAWSRRVDAGGCSCASEWATILKDHPPRFNGRRDLWHWRVQVHNAVNARLDRQIYWPRPEELP